MRHLITTADVRTWKFDRPSIFLGEWCRPKKQKHIWQKMDAIVAEPYGLGRAQRDIDHALARSMEEEITPILCGILNKYHGTQHDSIFWQILLGHWLRRYVNVIFNRVKTLEYCFQVHPLSGTTVFSNTNYSLAPLDSYAAIWACDDSRWNNALYLSIISLLGRVNFPIEVIHSDTNIGYRWHAESIELPLKQKILKFAYRQVGNLIKKLVRENDIFVINSYLPKEKEIALHLALRQAPQFWISSMLEVTTEPDKELRKELSKQALMGSNNSLSDILYLMLFELLPVCYLEGFAELTKKVERLAWPGSPEIIFTSNNFDTDEVFKLWTALKVTSGSKYVAGQHGSNYGTHRYIRHTVEEITSHKFLTWGWKDDLSQHTPAFIFKSVGRGGKACDPKGGLLLVEMSLGHRLDIWDTTTEFMVYFEDQKCFIEKLNKNIRKDLTVRLHPASSSSASLGEEEWTEFDAKIKLDIGLSDISKSIKHSRLVVHSYDSTGVLENLSNNIPTLIFWRNDLDHLRDSAKPYYHLLVDAGILHLSPESAAIKINEIWEYVEDWWMQPSIQEAREKFCDRYAKTSNNSICKLKQILLSTLA